MGVFATNTILDDVFHVLLGAAGHININILYAALGYQLLYIDDNWVLDSCEILLGYWKGQYILDHI